MTEKPEIHISDIRSFRQCRRKWQWSSRLGRNLEPAIPYAPFFTGKAVHAALEFKYVKNVHVADTIDTYLASEEDYLDRIGTLWPMEREKLDDEIYTVRRLIDHYFLWQENDDTPYGDRNLEFHGMEIKWEVPMEVQVGSTSVATTFAGRFDGYVKHIPTGRNYIFETKTARSVDSFLQTLATDQQGTFYLWGAQSGAAFDEPTYGVLFNVMSKTLPKQPKLTASGKMSRNKKEAPTWFYYVRALRESFPGITDEQIGSEYGAFLQELRSKTSKYFVRYPLTRSKHQLDICVEGIKQTASEMLNPDTPIYPSPDWMNCSFCLFKGPCIAKDAGGNFEVLLEHEFHLRTGHESMRKDG